MPSLVTQSASQRAHDPSRETEGKNVSPDARQREIPEFQEANRVARRALVHRLARQHIKPDKQGAVARAIGLTEGEFSKRLLQHGRRGLGVDDAWELYLEYPELLNETLENLGFRPTERVADPGPAALAKAWEEEAGGEWSEAKRLEMRDRVRRRASEIEALAKGGSR